MKLLAIRLANVGRFVEPIAVEDLSGGLDVLAGPNELGKSTLLKAVKLALFARHTSRSEDVGSLRPYGGGAPVVEIELSAGTGRWRLRKRFLAQAACELQCLTSGRQWRGAEAEAELPRLLGSPAGPGDGDGRLAMLWVSQGDALQAFDPADAKRHAGGIDALEAALAREVAAVAAGERVRTLRRAVHQRLGELVTPTGRPKTRGPLDAAQKDQAARRSAREAAGRERDAILARLERLGVLKARESEIGNAVAREARRTAIDGARRALETAAAAQRHRDLAAEKLAARESERVGARARQDQAAALISELGRSSAQAAAARDALARDEGRLAGIEHELAIALHAAAEAKARIDALDREHASALAAERRAADLQRLRDGQQRAAEAAERSARAAVLAAQVRGLPVTAELVGAAQREHGDILALEGQLRTASPTITIAYEAGAGPRFASDGVALADGSVLRPRAPIVIDVPGVGSITIAPGGGEALADMEADLGAHRAALQQLLERGGARDIADLARRLEQRRAADTELAAIAAEIRTLAPQGIEQLTAEVATLRRALPDAGEADDGRASGAIAADLATARAAVTARTSEATRLESAANALRLERAALMSRIDTLGQRQAQIADELGPVEGRGARLAALAEAASAAERAANEAAARFGKLTTLVQRGAARAGRLGRAGARARVTRPARGGSRRGRRCRTGGRPGKRLRPARDRAHRGRARGRAQRGCRGAVRQCRGGARGCRCAIAGGQR